MKTDLEKVYEACEVLEQGTEQFSCLALAAADNGRGKQYSCSKLMQQYAEFYEQNWRSGWGFSYSRESDGVNERILALLLFAEVELGGLD